jgi:hypothetical protein
MTNYVVDYKGLTELSPQALPHNILYDQQHLKHRQIPLTPHRLQCPGPFT